MNAVIDQSTAALLITASDVAIINFLGNAVPDVEVMLALEVPNYPKGLPITGPLVDWVWQRRERRLIVNTDVDDRLRNASALALAKSKAYVELAWAISMARARALQGMALQDLIYAAKRREAEHYLATCGPLESGDPLDFPYLFQYAELSGLEPLVAAREILLKGELADGGLLRSEYFRLKYLKLLRETASVAAVQAILVGFKRELYN